MTIDHKTIKLFNKIDTVHGHCEECQEEAIMVAIVSEYYRCTNCGHDTKQHINNLKTSKKKDSRKKHDTKVKAEDNLNT